MVNNKLKNAILFFLNKREIKNLGTTKLAKLLYYADFGFYSKYHKSITGESYIKRDFGPLPQNFYNILENLSESNKVRPKKKKVFSFDISYYIPLEKPNMKLFSQEELNELKKTAKKYKNETANELTALSHKEVPWLFTKNLGEKIDYSFAYQVDTKAEVENFDKNRKFINSLINIMKKECPKIMK